MEINERVKSFIPIAKGISETFGSNCEVIVHDFSQEGNMTIVAAFNGHITGRKVGVPLDKVTFEKINRYKDGEDIYNYTGKGIGRELKSTTMFIKNNAGNNIGCLCINYDITDLLVFKPQLDELIKINKSEVEELGVINRVNDVLLELVNTTIKSYNRPVIYLTKEEKVNIVRILEDKGVFMIKGAIDFVAEALQVSRYTIYNYLDEIRQV